MAKTFPILYSRATTGATQQWTIFVKGDEFWTEAGQVGGALTISAPTKAKGKNQGKKNETTPEQQAEIEALAKWEKKIKRNYFEDINAIDSGFLEPQLAKPNAEYIDDVDWSLGQVVDDKLNGFACVITAKGAFTRNNEKYHSIPHILKELKPFFDRNPNAYLQGELFNFQYVNNLGKIGELIAVTRELKDITPELLAESERMVEFHWYDGYGFENVDKPDSVEIDTPLLERRRMINLHIVRYNGYQYIKKVHYDICFSFAEMKKLADAYIAKGGEGKIIKNPKAPYQHKRTKDLLKWKKQEDAEFKIVDDEQPFKEGKGNSAGCAESVWCELPNGVRDKRFKANIEGGKDKLREMFAHPERYRGKYITVRFQEYSPYLVPLINYTDMVIRDEIEGKAKK